jgi:hypothetical protein
MYSYIYVMRVQAIVYTITGIHNIFHMVFSIT